jgi:putative hemolysin
MTSILIEILVLAVLILANGFFAMSEIAVVSARKTRLQQQAQEGDRRAQAALELARAPNQFLATIQIGITLVGILAGAFGGATIARELAVVLDEVPFLATYSQAISVGIVVVTITYFSLVIGELVPKRLGLSKAEQLAAGIAPFMKTLSRLASPFVRVLNFSTEAVVRVLGVRPEPETPVSEEEIKLLLRYGTRAGTFEPAEQAMVERVFRLDDVTISGLMTPRPDIIWLDLEDPADEVRDIVAAGSHSRYPVARGDLDHPAGLVYSKDLLANLLEGQPFGLEATVHPALYLPERISVLEALDRLKEAHADAALVINEYGGFEGLLTLTDILQAIVGDIPAPGQLLEQEAVRRTDGSWLLDGALPADEVKELLGLESLPRGYESQYQTLGGLVMLCLGRVPGAGDGFEWAGWHFEVMDMDGHRVDKVLVVPPAEEADASPQQDAENSESP